MNPYDILGVAPGATADAINNAYREKLNELDNAGLPDDAYKAHLKDINAAYDSLMFSGGGNSQSTSQNSSTSFGDIRAKIKESKFDEAETILDGIPFENHNAEWHYLKGQVQYKKGWLEEAEKHFQKAKEMDPYNFEYDNAYENVQSKKGGFFREERRQNEPDGGCMPGCSCCDVCSALLCADCFCSCCKDCN